VLGFVMLAALLGLFGRGPLSDAAVSENGLHLAYQRLERYQRPTSIQLRINTQAGKAAGVFIEGAYLDAIRIERVMPQPEKVEANARGSIYHFAAGSDPITVTFHIELEQFGFIPGQIGLAGGPTISFRQFVYP
jgi:hypothetical protein